MNFYQSTLAFAGVIQSFLSVQLVDQCQRHFAVVTVDEIKGYLQITEIMKRRICDVFCIKNSTRALYPYSPVLLRNKFCVTNNMNVIDVAYLRRSQIMREQRRINRRQKTKVDLS